MEKISDFEEVPISSVGEVFSFEKNLHDAGVIFENQPSFDDKWSEAAISSDQKSCIVPTTNKGFTMITEEEIQIDPPRQLPHTYNSNGEIQYGNPNTHYPKPPTPGKAQYTAQGVRYDPADQRYDIFIPGGGGGLDKDCNGAHGPYLAPPAHRRQLDMRVDGPREGPEPVNLFQRGRRPGRGNQRFVRGNRRGRGRGNGRRGRGRNNNRRGRNNNNERYHNQQNYRGVQQQLVGNMHQNTQRYQPQQVQQYRAPKQNRAGQVVFNADQSYIQRYGIKQDRRKPIYFSSGLPTEKVQQIQQIFLDGGMNKYKIDNHFAKKAHPHPILALSRIFAMHNIIDDMVNVIQKNDLKIFRILNVGSGFTQRFMRTFKDRVEALKPPVPCVIYLDDVDTYMFDDVVDPYNLQQYTKMPQKYMSMAEYDRTPNGLFRYKMNVCTLEDFPEPEVAYDCVVFMHSVYYFKGPELGKILLKLIDTTAAIPPIITGVYHQFNSPKGSFTFVGDETKFTEGEWKTQDGQIVMQTSGNTGAYAHPPPVWVTNGGVKVNEEMLLSATSSETVEGFNTWEFRLHLVKAKQFKQLRRLPTDQGQTIPDTEYIIPKVVWDDIMRLTLQKPDLTGRHQHGIRRIISTQIKKNNTTKGYGPYLDRIFELVLTQAAESRKKQGWWEWMTKPRLTPYLKEKKSLIAVLFSSPGKALRRILFYLFLTTYLVIVVWLFYPMFFRVFQWPLSIMVMLSVTLGPWVVMVMIMLAVILLGWRCCILPPLLIIVSRFSTAANPVYLPEWYESALVDGDTGGSVYNATLLYNTSADLRMRGVNTIVDPEDYEMCCSATFVYDEDYSDVREALGTTVIGPITPHVPKCHASNAWNSYVSARTRACVKPPLFDKNDDGVHEPDCLCLHCEYWNLFREAQLRHFPYEDFDVMSFSDWNRRFPGGKAKTNTAWYERLTQGGATAANFCYECFTKREALVPGIGKTYNQALRPRMISGVSKLWKVSTGPWMQSLSVWLKGYLNCTKNVWYVSGATSSDINTWVNEHMEMMSDPILYWLDFSKYDSCQKHQSISAENKFCERFGAKNHIYEWEHVKNAKLNTRGYAKGVKYSVSATRGSGENGTSVLNSILNASIFYLVCDLLKDTYPNIYDHVYAAVMGDDFISIIDGQHIDIQIFRGKYQKVMEALKFTIVDGVSRDPINADFLSMVFYPTEHGVRVGKKPGRNIMKSGVIIDKGHNFTENERVAILASNLNSALPTANHVPVLRVWVKTQLDYIHKKYSDLKKPKNYTFYNRSQWKGSGCLWECDAATWHAFEEKTGLNYSDEVNFGKSLQSHLEKCGLFSIFDHYVIDELIKF